MSSEIDFEVGAAVQEYQASVALFDTEVARILGVGASDLACLEMVLSGHAVTPRNVADRLGFTTGSVTTMVDRLVQRGYLTRSPHPNDGRRILLRATPALQAQAAATYGPVVESAQSAVLRHFSTHELRVVIRFMQRAADHQRSHVERLRNNSADQ